MIFKPLAVQNGTVDQFKGRERKQKTIEPPACMADQIPTYKCRKTLDLIMSQAKQRAKERKSTKSTKSTKGQKKRQP